MAEAAAAAVVAVAASVAAPATSAVEFAPRLAGPAEESAAAAVVAG